MPSDVLQPGLRPLALPHEDRPSELRRGLVTCLPVLAGVIPFAMVLGAEAAQKGLGLFEVPLMTGMNFAGGSEFAAIHLWTTPPRVLLIAGVTFVVNSRHLLMGGIFAPFLQRLPARHLLPAIFLMCDESWALGVADAQRRGALSLPYYFGTAVPLFLVWVAFTTLGAALGPVLGDVAQYGFDMAFPAVFLVLLRGMWRGPRESLPWLVSVVTAAVVYLAVPGQAYIAAGVLSGLAAASLRKGDA